MSRYKLTLDYDGTPFGGWQRQKNVLSVQQALEEAVLSATGERVLVKGAGRTDAGVHALGQVAHLDLANWIRGAFTLGEALNAHLVPHPIGVLSVQEVADGFDARFSATKRHYLYLVHNRRAPLTLSNARAHLVKPKLDVSAMHEAGQCLIGRHDFSTFRNVECQAKSPIRTLDMVSVAHLSGADAPEEGKGLIVFRFAARSFLHSQVRSMVGALLQVGLGKWTGQDLAAALAAKDRARCGFVAPACGLYLAKIEYGESRRHEAGDTLA